MLVAPCHHTSAPRPFLSRRTRRAFRRMGHSWLFWLLLLSLAAWTHYLTPISFGARTDLAITLLAIPFDAYVMGRSVRHWWRD